MKNYQNKREEMDLRMIETVTRLVEKVDELTLNHLPHFQNRLDKIDERMWQGGITIITILTGILVTLLWK